MTRRRVYEEVMRRLALASFKARNKSGNEPQNIYLRASGDWARAEAVYNELLKIDEERYEANVISDN